MADASNLDSLATTMRSAGFESSRGWLNPMLVKKDLVELKPELTIVPCKPFLSKVKKMWFMTTRRGKRMHQWLLNMNQQHLSQLSQQRLSPEPEAAADADMDM